MKIFMKKTAIIIGSLFLTAGSFAQISKDVYINPVKKEITTRFDNRKEKRYYHIIQVNLLLGNGQAAERNVNYYPDYYSSSISPMYSNSDTRNKMTISPSVTITNGYKFNKHWAAGAGVGFEIFDHFLFPLFAELRYTLWNGKISPFLNMKGGHAFGNLKQKHYDHLNLNWSPYHVDDAGLRHYGGLMLHPEIGVKVPLDKNDDLLLTVAYRVQKTKSVARKDYDSGQFEEWEHKGELNRLSLGVAIMFR
jgi:hypothetical protein